MIQSIICDVYVTKLLPDQVPQHTEPEKHGPWKLFSVNDYKNLAQQKKTTPTHTGYVTEIIQALTTEKLVFVQRLEEVQDALFGEAEVYGERINILIDSGAVGCIIAKRFLDHIDRPIEAATNVKIIDVNGKKTTPLGLMRQVPIKIRDIEVKMDMIVTESREYNVLLGNMWLKHVNALIDYKKNQMHIEFDEQKQIIPITCTQKLSPTQFTIIDTQEELELEDEDDFEELLRFNKAEIVEDDFIIDDRKYYQGFMDYCNTKYKKGTNSQGPGKCLCKALKEEEQCLPCSQIEEEWSIYNAITDEPKKEKPVSIHLEEGKDVPIGDMSNN